MGRGIGVEAEIGIGASTLEQTRHGVGAGAGSTGRAGRRGEPPHKLKLVSGKCHPSFLTGSNAYTPYRLFTRSSEEDAAEVKKRRLEKLAAWKKAGGAGAALQSKAPAKMLEKTEELPAW